MNRCLIPSSNISYLDAGGRAQVVDKEEGMAGAINGHRGNGAGTLKH